MNTLNHIRNFLRIDDLLATSGMPKPDDFTAMRQAGFDVVINLALPTSDNALPNEGELVSAQGMTYVHIPVKFNAPTEDDLMAFFAAMQKHQGRKMLLHCAANKRVTAFLGLYRVIRQKWEIEPAFAPARAVWEPDAVWSSFVSAMLAKLKK